MNKFRVLTTDGEWVYTTINVMEDCIRCPLMDKEGKQVLNPTIKLRKDTLSQCVLLHLKCKDECSEYYEGDIVHGITFDSKHEVILLIERWSFSSTYGLNFGFSYIKFMPISDRHQYRIPSNQYHQIEHRSIKVRTLLIA